MKSVVNVADHVALIPHLCSVDCCDLEAMNLQCFLPGEFLSLQSAQYCFPTRANPHGLLLVCEVALGRTHDVREAQFMDAPPRGRHSTRALGKHMPDTLQVNGC